MSSEVKLVHPVSISVRAGFNPRVDYGDIASLSQSIVQHGVLSALLVQDVRGDLVLIDGHRRLAAVMSALESGADIPLVPVRVLPAMSEGQSLILAFSTNTGLQLKPIEEAELFQRLQADGYSVASIAHETARSESYVKQRLLLLQAGAEVTQAIQDGKLSLDAAYDIIRQAGSEERQEEMLKKELTDPESSRQERKTKKAKNSGNKKLNDIIQYTNDLRLLLADVDIDPDDQKVEDAIQQHIEQQRMEIGVLWGSIQTLMVQAGISETNPFRLKINT